MSKLIGVFIGIIVSISLAFQLWQVHVFINAGPRFTAQDGQALCERIQAVEKSIGRAEKPCEYGR